MMSPDILAGGLPKNPKEWGKLLNSLKEKGFDSKQFQQLNAMKKSAEARQLLVSSLGPDVTDIDKLSSALNRYLATLEKKTNWVSVAATVIPGVAVARHVWKYKKTYATIAALLVGAVAYVGLGGPGVALAQAWLMQKLVAYGLPSGAAAVSAIVSGAQTVAQGAKGLAVSAGQKIAEQLPKVAEKMGVAKDAVKEGAGNLAKGAKGLLDRAKDAMPSAGNIGKKAAEVLEKAPSFRRGLPDGAAPVPSPDNLPPLVAADDLADIFNGLQ